MATTGAESAVCGCHVMQVVDGPFGYSTPVVGRYCGRRRPPLVESSGRYLWLRFHSDDSIEYVGFHLVYEFIPAAADDDERDTASGRLRWIHSAASPYVLQNVVCPSCGFAAVGPAGRIYRSIAAAAACGGRTRAVPRCQRT